MVPKKSKSKRTTLKMKYKIEKRVNDHHRKQRKEAKKIGGKKKKIVDTVPKMMPNRESIIANLQNRKPLLQMTEMVKRDAPVLVPEEKKEIIVQSGNRLVHQAIDAAEAVVEILDARCPEAFRNFTVEKYIQSTKKPFFKVLTKIDLVHASVAEKWKKAINGTVFMVKCNTQSQKYNLSRNSGPSSAKGIDALYGQLMKYRTVAFFGAPSVGKSSLINSLCRERVAQSGKNDGTTKGLMEVAVSKKLKVLDTPGIYPDNNNNLIKILQNRDVELMFKWFVESNGLHHLVLAYNIPHVLTCDDFVKAIADRFKYFSKGKIDLYRATEKIIKDFRDLGFWQCEPAPSGKGFILCPSMATGMDIDVDSPIPSDDNMDEFMQDDLGQ
eukprot:NODE_26_length_35450_cov_0.398320.p7 type:complete len:383 gc:universal NODE_26_length_35450_cov_0.398320:4707-5855(+)